MYKVGISGHFGFGRDLANGQTVKTKNIALELEKVYGEDAVCKIDSSGGIKHIFKICAEAFKLTKKSENVIMLPAHNGLLIFTPLFRFFNLFFKRKLHYVVIGGWLPEYLGKHKITKRLLRGFDKIYVEAYAMKKNMEMLGLGNVVVMPNFKNVKIVKDIKHDFAKPYKFCTFSRVVYEKGVEHATKAIDKINNELGETVCKLDIYGPVDDGYADRFNKLLAEYSSFVTYKGCVPAEMSTDIIKDYYGLLFPTFYHGEGFAGTLIDAFSAGVPVIASDWRYNAEIVEHEKNGLICAHDDVESLAQSIKHIIENEDLYRQMASECINSARKYSAQEVIRVLTSQL